jgi:hypothetical protein
MCDSVRDHYHAPCLQGKTQQQWTLPAFDFACGTRNRINDCWLDAPVRFTATQTLSIARPLSCRTKATRVHMYQRGQG